MYCISVTIFLLLTHQNTFDLYLRFVNKKYVYKNTLVSKTSSPIDYSETHKIIFQSEIIKRCFAPSMTLVPPTPPSPLPTHTNAPDLRYEGGGTEQDCLTNAHVVRGSRQNEARADETPGEFLRSPR